MEAPTFLPFGEETTTILQIYQHLKVFKDLAWCSLMMPFAWKKVSRILPMVSILKNLENLGPTAIPAFSAMRGYGSRTLRSRNSSWRSESVSQVLPMM